jgi:hypothetical protein
MAANNRKRGQLDLQRIGAPKNWFPHQSEFLIFIISDYQRLSAVPSESIRPIFCLHHAL